MQNTRLLLCTAIASTFFTALTFAETGIQVGPMRVLPTLGVSIGQDDNVLRSANNEISSFLTVVSPGIKIETGDSVRRFVFSYEGEIGRYSKDEANGSDFDDHLLAASVDLNPTDRLRIKGGAGYARGHDNRGEGAQQGQFIAAEVDEYRRTNADVTVAYGAPGARGLLEFSAGTTDLAYRNNRQYTRFRDRSDTYVGLLGGWRVGGRTSAIGSVTSTDISFDETPALRPSRDSTELEYMVGVNYDATGKTSGRALVGRIEKDFDDPRVADFSGIGWTVGAQFRPRTYSVFDLTTSRRTDESDSLINVLDGSSFALTRDVTLAWTHSWTDRFQTALDIGIGTSDYRAVADDGLTLRKDDFTAVGASASYNFRDWLRVGAGLKSYQRDSTDAQFEFDQNVFLLSFEGTL